VVLQVGAAMVLLTGSGLLVGSFVRLVRVDLGYNPAGVVTFDIELPSGRYRTPESQHRFLGQFEGELTALPGVAAVGLEGQRGIGFDALVVDGRPAGDTDAWFGTVTPGYFTALGLPMRQGRTFSADERRASEVIVNEAFLRRHQNAGIGLGHRLQWGNRFGTREIVGIVANSRQTFESREEAMLFLPAETTRGFQRPSGLLRMARPGDAGGAASSVRDIIRRIDPQLAAFNVTTLEETLAHQAAASRFNGLLSLACALLALLLAAIGLYGVLAYAVRMRWSEFGIRVALGADPGALMRGVLRQGLTLTAIGLGLGLVGSSLATQSLRGLLFGVAPHDAPTFVGMAGVFALTAALACCIPARRAMRVDPAVALRSE
jgi:predicted permease